VFDGGRVDVPTHAKNINKREGLIYIHGMK
jgi:hypothetical protein